MYGATGPSEPGVHHRPAGSLPDHRAETSTISSPQNGRTGRRRIIGGLHASWSFYLDMSGSLAVAKRPRSRSHDSEMAGGLTREPGPIAY